jgi:putative transposase
MLSIESGCLNKISQRGEEHLRLVIRDKMAHFHTERNHQGLGSHIMHSEEDAGDSEGTINTRFRFEGFLSYDYRSVA